MLKIHLSLRSNLNGLEKIHVHVRILAASMLKIMLRAFKKIYHDAMASMA